MQTTASAVWRALHFLSTLMQSVCEELLSLKTFAAQEINLGNQFRQTEMSFLKEKAGAEMKTELGFHKS